MDRIRRRAGKTRFVRWKILENLVATEQKERVVSIVAAGRVVPIGWRVRIFVRHLLDPLSFFGSEGLIDKAFAVMIDAVFVERCPQTVQIRADIAFFPSDIFLFMLTLLVF